MNVRSPWRGGVVFKEAGTSRGDWRLLLLLLLLLLLFLKVEFKRVEDQWP